MQCISETGLDFINQELKSNMQTLESFTVTPGTCFKKLYRISFHVDLNPEYSFYFDVVYDYEFSACRFMSRERFGITLLRINS